MKPAASLIAAMAVGAGVTAASLRADFVHLAFRSESSLFGARGAQPGYDWDTGGTLGNGSPVRLDLYYDPDATPLFGGFYQFTDPAKNYFHISALEPGILPPLNITRPIDSILMGASSMNVTFVHQDQPYETFDFSIYFNSPLAGGTNLPLPPLPGLSLDPFSGLGASSFQLYGGEGMFRLPDPGSGFLSAQFDAVHGSVNDVFSPVPEPSVYGLAGAAVLLAAALYRLRRPKRRVLWIEPFRD